jgi:hypothetical protein
MKMHAAIDVWAIPPGVPGSHHVHFVSARRNALCDRFHEAADRVTLKSWI